MSKTTSSTQLSQTVLQILHQDGINEATIAQSPPLIIDQRGDNGDDQKVGIDGSKLKVDNEGVGDENKVGDNKNENNNVCIIDVKNNVEDGENESKARICRICQLGCSDHLVEGVGNVNLVQLGCSCKGDLGFSHYHCAQAWFLHKGNRICEICGKPAKNIQGIDDINYQGLEAEVISSINIAMSPTDERSNRCIKSFCNFILVVLIVAFILPWVLHPTKLW